MEEDPGFLKFGIWCQVWGGVTGLREAWYKLDGKQVIFCSCETAEEKAAYLNKTMNGPYAKANFHYRVEEIGGV